MTSRREEQNSGAIEPTIVGFETEIGLQEFQNLLDGDKEAKASTWLSAVTKKIGKRLKKHRNCFLAGLLLSCVVIYFVGIRTRLAAPKGHKWQQTSTHITKNNGNGVFGQESLVDLHKAAVNLPAPKSTKKLILVKTPTKPKAKANPKPAETETTKENEEEPEVVSGAIPFKDIQGVPIHNLKARWIQQQNGIQWFFIEIEDQKAIFIEDPNNPTHKPIINYYIDGETIFSKPDPEAWYSVVGVASENKYTIQKEGIELVKKTLGKPELIASVADQDTKLPKIVAFSGLIRALDIAPEATSLEMKTIFIPDQLILNTKTKAKTATKTPQVSVWDTLMEVKGTNLGKEYLGVSLSYLTDEKMQISIDARNLFKRLFALKDHPYARDIITKTQDKDRLATWHHKEAVEYIDPKTHKSSYYWLNIGHVMKMAQLQMTPKPRTTKIDLKKHLVVPVTDWVIQEYPTPGNVALMSSEGSSIFLVSLKVVRDLLEAKIKEGDEKIPVLTQITKKEAFSAASINEEIFCLKSKFFKFDPQKIRDYTILHKSTPRVKQIWKKPQPDAKAMEGGLVILSEESLENLWNKRDVLFKQGVILKPLNPLIKPWFPTLVKRGRDGMTRVYYIDADKIKQAMNIKPKTGTKATNGGAVLAAAVSKGRDKVLEAKSGSSKGSSSKNLFGTGTLSATEKKEVIASETLDYVVGNLDIIAPETGDDRSRRIDSAKLMAWVKELQKHPKGSIIQFFSSSTLEKTDPTTTLKVIQHEKDGHGGIKFPPVVLQLNIKKFNEAIKDPKNALHAKLSAMIVTKGYSHVVDRARDVSEYYICDIQMAARLLAGPAAKYIEPAVVGTPAKGRNMADYINCGGADKEVLVLIDMIEKCKVPLADPQCDLVDKIVRVGLKPITANVKKISEKTTKLVVLEALRHQKHPFFLSDVFTCKEPFPYSAQYNSPDRRKQYERAFEAIGKRPETKDDYKLIVIAQKRCFLKLTEFVRGIVEGTIDPKFGLIVLEAPPGVGSVQMDGLIVRKTDDGQEKAVSSDDLNILRFKDPETFRKLVVTPTAFLKLDFNAKSGLKAIYVDRKGAYIPTILEKSPSALVELELEEKGLLANAALKAAQAEDIGKIVTVINRGTKHLQK